MRLRLPDHQTNIIRGYPLNAVSSTPETSVRGARRLINRSVRFRSGFVFSVTDQMIRLVFQFCKLKQPVPNPLMRLLRLREYRGGGRGGDWSRQGSYATSVLQKTASFIEVNPLNIYQTTLTYCWLPGYLRRSRVNNVFFLSLFNHALPHIQSQTGVA
jgi:hypothetical protein